MAGRRLTLPWRHGLVLLVLGACSTPGQDVGPAIEAARDANRASLGVLGSSTATDAPPASATAAPVVASGAAPPALPAGRRPAIGVAPESAAALIGAPPESVLVMLGTPQLRRSEGTGDIWLYAGPDCHLDIVFYAEADGTRRVAHAQARADGAAPRTETECLAGIAQRGA